MDNHRCKQLLCGDGDYSRRLTVSHRRYISETPLLIPVVGLATGIAVCSYIPVHLLWIAAVCGVVGALVSLWRNGYRALILSLCFIVGCATWWLSLPPGIETGVVWKYAGTVVSASDYGSTQRCIVESDNGVRIGVAVFDYEYRIEKGDRVGFKGLLLPPVIPTTFPDEPDGRRAALLDRLSATCTVDGDSFMITEYADGVQGMLNNTRQRLLDAIRYSGLSQGAGEFMSAILLGENNVSEEIRENFAHAGLAHLLALSGTHVSTITLLLVVLLLPIELAGGRRWRLALTLVALWMYAMLTGMSLSVVRAVIMATFLIVSRITGRSYGSLNALFGAALLIMLFSPVSLLKPGFQLSFLAVAGIVTVIPPAGEYLRRYRMFENRLMYTLAIAFILPITAVVATAPLSAYYFHNFPVWFLLANVVAGVLVPLLMLGGGILMLAGCCGLTVGWLAVCVDGLYDVIAWVAESVVRLPGGGLDQGIYFDGWILPVIYAGMILMWLGWNNRRRVFIVNGTLTVITGLTLIVMCKPVYPEREVFPIYVNRGVALVCRDGSEGWILTDAADKYYPEISRQTDRLLTDYLAKRGARLSSVKDVGVVYEASGMRIWFFRDYPVNGMEIAPGDILVVTSGFRGDVMEIRRSYPDAVIVLSPALPPVRRKRYADRLNAMGCDYLFNLPVPSR